MPDKLVRSPRFLIFPAKTLSSRFLEGEIRGKNKRIAHLESGGHTRGTPSIPRSRRCPDAWQVNHDNEVEKHSSRRKPIGQPGILRDLGAGSRGEPSEWHVVARSGEDLAEFLKRPGKWCSWCDYLPVCLKDEKRIEETLVQITHSK